MLPDQFFFMLIRQHLPFVITEGSGGGISAQLSGRCWCCVGYVTGGWRGDDHYTQQPTVLRPAWPLWRFWSAPAGTEETGQGEITCQGLEIKRDRERQGALWNLQNVSSLCMQQALRWSCILKVLLWRSLMVVACKHAVPHNCSRIVRVMICSCSRWKKKNSGHQRWKCVDYSWHFSQSVLW